VTDYLPIIVMFALAVLFAGLSFVAARFLSPRRPTAAKAAPYECGIVPSREPPERFPVKFYLVAMIFIMFDIEIIFLFPYAVVHRELAVYGFVAMAIFVGLFFLSFLYELAEGGLDWGPVKQLRSPGPMTDRARTSDTTVRRVGLEGREEVAA
jgi:NADH-quinone oxidoreductase subunit A